MKKELNGDVEHSLRLGWSCYWRRGDAKREDSETWHNFQTCESFWQFLFSCTGKRIKLWCMARNLSFDFTILRGWHYLKQAGYTLKFFHSKGATTIISLVKDNSSIVFLDSMNWFVESLEKTGKRIGISKIRIDFDTCTTSDLNLYCRNDVLIEKENFALFIRFLTDNRIARLCYTQGSTAMAAYLSRHYKTTIWIHNNKQAIDLERASYKGGRVEAFHIGKLNSGPYTVVDVNSLYPFVMRQYEYPYKYHAMCHYPTLAQLRDYLSQYAIVAEVVIRTDVPVYPVRTERTMFPTGNFRTCLCTPELLYALDRGHIESVIQAVLYARADLFSTYVNSLYAMRMAFKKAGNEAYVELCKKLMNTLYGKFGQRAEDWEKVAEDPNEPDHYEYLIEPDKPGKVTLRWIMGECFKCISKGESFDSFPAIAAHVTAYGRMHLWSLIQRAGEGNYYYCDTDSLIVNNAGLKRLKSEMSESELGKLKVVEVSKKLTIYGLKDYETDSKTVVKGIRKNAERIADDTFAQDRWPSIQGMLRSGIGDRYIVERTVKHLARTYTKGEVLPDGSVLPTVLSLD